MTELEMFRAFLKDRFGFTHCDGGVTAEGTPWVSFSDGETYTFFYFRKEGDAFDKCFSRRYLDHAEIESPPQMLRLRDDFKERLQERK